MPRQDPGEPYYRVDSDEARQILDSEPADTVVVDVRRDDEWVTGHVTGAIHIPIDDLADRIDQVPQDRKVLFICAAGVRSGLACEVASSMGYDTENYTISKTARPRGSPAGTQFLTETIRNSSYRTNRRQSFKPVNIRSINWLQNKRKETSRTSPWRKRG